MLLKMFWIVSIHFPYRSQNMILLFSFWTLGNFERSEDLENISWRKRNCKSAVIPFAHCATRNLPCKRTLQPNCIFLANWPNFLLLAHTHGLFSRSSWQIFQQEKGNPEIILKLRENKFKIHYFLPLVINKYIKYQISHISMH